MIPKPVVLEGIEVYVDRLETRIRELPYLTNTYTEVALKFAPDLSVAQYLDSQPGFEFVPLFRRLLGDGNLHAATQLHARPGSDAPTPEDLHRRRSCLRRRTGACQPAHDRDLQGGSDPRVRPDQGLHQHIRRRNGNPSPALTPIVLLTRSRGAPYPRWLRVPLHPASSAVASAATASPFVPGASPFPSPVRAWEPAAGRRGSGPRASVPASRGRPPGCGVGNGAFATVTTMPVGIWVSRTPDSTLFWCCPPLPPEREGVDATLGQKVSSRARDSGALL